MSPSKISSVPSSTEIPINQHPYYCCLSPPHPASSRLFSTLLQSDLPETQIYPIFLLFKTFHDFHEQPNPWHGTESLLKVCNQPILVPGSLKTPILSYLQSLSTCISLWAASFLNPLWFVFRSSACHNFLREASPTSLIKQIPLTKCFQSILCRHVLFLLFFSSTNWILSASLFKVPALEKEITNISVHQDSTA